MLELTCQSPGAPTRFPTWLVIIRSLRQARAPQFLQERQWWEAIIPAGTSKIQETLIFAPSEPEKPESYLTNHTATCFLEELHDRLDGRAPGNIILIGYGFGGYVIKKALTIAHNHTKFSLLYNAILAIAFVGTVRNDEHGDFDQAILISAALGLGLSTRNVVSEHQECLTEAKSACAKFRTFHLPCRLTAFCETRDTPYSKYHSWFEFWGQHAPVSTKNLGSLHSDIYIALDFDHETLSGYPWESSLFRDTFRKRIQEFLFSLERNILPIEPPCHIGPTSPVDAFPIIRRPSFPHISIDNPCHVLDQNLHPGFVGRKDILDHIESVLSPKNLSNGIRKFAVVGFGGMGKTQVALKYAHESRGVFPIILWANADTPGKLAQSFSEFDQVLGLSNKIESRQRGSCLRVKKYLRTTDQPWLLVFDNVSPDVSRESWIDNYWPSGDNGSLLITTREAVSLGPFTGSIEELGELSEPESAELILDLSRKDKLGKNLVTATAICSRLGCHPLAILTAASIVRGHGLDLETFLEDYTNSDLIRYPTHPMSGPEARYHSSLRMVLRSHFARLDEEEDKEVRRALGILSCLDHSGIEEQLLRKIPGRQDTPACLQPLCDIKRVRKLVEKNLIRRNEPNGEKRREEKVKISMHQLIQDFCLMDMEEHGELEDAFCCAVAFIRSAWPVPERHNRQNRELWNTQQNLIQHIESLKRRYSDSQVFATEAGESHAFAELCYNGAWYLYERGNFQSARPLLETAEEICNRHPENSELILADIYGAYGSIDSESNNRESCKENFTKQLERLRIAMDKGLEERATVREALSYGGLANAAMGLNEYEEAEPLYKECLRIWTGCPGDPDIYIPHLAVCLTLQGKTDEAEILLRDMIEKRKKKYGDEDNTNYRPGIAYLALGNTHIRQGRLDEAEQAHSIALRIIGSTLGKAHHRYADVCYKVGWHLDRQAKYHDSLQSLHQALGIYEKDAQDLYCNEAARTCFLMSRVSAKVAGEYARVGNIVESGEWEEISEWYGARAKQLRQKIALQSVLTKEGETEASYDDLVMFWSR